MKILPVIFSLFFCLRLNAAFVDHVVTNPGDDIFNNPPPTGSLRATIDYINSNPATGGDIDRILFNISGVTQGNYATINLVTGINIYQPLVIDGETPAPGGCNCYPLAGGPYIIIVCTNCPWNSVFDFYTSYAGVQGLIFKDFVANSAISFNGITTVNSFIKDNVFYNNTAQTDWWDFTDPNYLRAAITIWNSKKSSATSGFITITNNYIGTDPSSTSGIGLSKYTKGIFIDNSTDVVVGGRTSGTRNIFTTGDLGVWVYDSQRIFVTGNSIYNNTNGVCPPYWIADRTRCFLAIALGTEYPHPAANNGVKPPTIYDVVVGGSTVDVYGTSGPNDIIELFRSTGRQNANTYETNLIATSSGTWHASGIPVTSNNNFLATATMVTTGNGLNTSELSNRASINKIKIQYECVDATLSVPDIFANYYWYQDGVAYGTNTSQITVTPTPGTPHNYYVVVDLFSGGQMQSDEVTIY